MAYTPESGIGLFSLQYINLFQNGGPFSNVTSRQNYKITIFKSFNSHGNY